MQLQDNYDWIVLGSHPGALLTASLVARLGFSVLMLPLGSHFSLWVSRSGQYVDPEPNFLMGIGRSGKNEGLVLKCLSQIGLTSPEREWIQTENHIPQVLTLTHRLSLLPTESLQGELHREFGKQFTKQLALVNVLKQVESETLSYWEDLPKRLTLNSNRKLIQGEPMNFVALRRLFEQSLGSERTASRLSSNLSSILSSHLSGNLSGNHLAKTWLSRTLKLSAFCQTLEKPELMIATQGLWYAITGNVEKDPVLFDILNIFSLARTGGSFKGGLSGYREFLFNLARRLGVQVPTKVECRRLFIDRGKFTGVQVTNRGSMISVGGGVLGCSLERAYSHMANTGKRLFRRRKDPLVPKGWRFTIGLTVHREAIPVGMQPRIVWQEKDAPVLEIETVNPKDYHLEDPEHRFLYLRTLMPYHHESLSHEYQRVIAGRMLRQAVEILPFLEYHVTRIYPDFRAGTNSDTFIGLTETLGKESSAALDELAEIYPFKTTDTIPDNLVVYEGNGIGSSTGIEGLFSASDESYPALGNLGPTVAALEAVAWMAHRSGFPGPLGQS